MSILTEGFLTVAAGQGWGREQGNISIQGNISMIMLCICTNIVIAYFTVINYGKGSDDGVVALIKQRLHKSL